VQWTDLRAERRELGRAARRNWTKTILTPILACSPRWTFMLVRQSGKVSLVKLNRVGLDWVSLRLLPPTAGSKSYPFTENPAFLRFLVAAWAVFTVFKSRFAAGFRLRMASRLTSFMTVFSHGKVGNASLEHYDPISAVHIVL